MATRKAAAVRDPAVEVAQWFATLVHPHHDGLARLRECVLAADPAIQEGIKWNVASFRTHEWFATLHVRSKAGFGMILHLGARKRTDLPADGLGLANPRGLLKWLGPDRALVEFADLAALRASEADLGLLLRAWICWLSPG